MKDGRVILLLLSIIILLSVILGVKILNNTPEKQREKIYKKYSETMEESNKNSNSGEFDFDFYFGEEEKSWIDNFKATPLGIVTAFIVIIVMIIGNVQLYNKLYISHELIRINIISILIYIASTILAIVPISLILNIVLPILSLGAIITYIVTAIMIEYKLFHTLDTSFLFILLIFIPVIGSILLNIIIGIRLANKFDRGNLFKIGLCILPNVFRPILGFIA